MSMDAAIREAAREAFADVDDATFWLMPKTGAAGAYGRSSSFNATVDEGDGLPCHLCLISNPTAKVLEKVGDKEAYKLHYAADDVTEPFLDMGDSGGYVLVRSSGSTPVAYGVVQAPANTPADEGIRTPRRWAIVVRLEKQPSVVVNP